MSPVMEWSLRVLPLCCTCGFSISLPATPRWNVIPIGLPAPLLPPLAISGQVSVEFFPFSAWSLGIQNPEVETAL